MRCDQIMKRDVECIGPGKTGEDAARKMKEENIGFLPVCDDSKKVLGTITDRDLAIRLVAEGKPASTPVGDLMTREVVACLPGDDVKRAAELFGRYRKSRLICVDEQGTLQGIISLSDLAQLPQDSMVAETLRNVTAREATLS